MQAVLKWIESNPVLFTVVLWPILTALITSAFSKPTPEFTAKWPRIAGLRMLVSDLGVNLPKVLDNVRLALTGKASVNVTVVEVPDDAPTTKLPKDPPSLPEVKP